MCIEQMYYIAIATTTIIIKEMSQRKEFIK